jgi:hypothetical protein
MYLSRSAAGVIYTFSANTLYASLVAMIVMFCDYEVAFAKTLFLVA